MIFFFKKGKEIFSNCAVALGNMLYEPARDVMLEYFSIVKSTETFLGILNYLGKIHHENCRAALRSAVIQMEDTSHSGIGSNKFITPS